MDEDSDSFLVVASVSEMGRGPTDPDVRFERTPAIWAVLFRRPHVLAFAADAPMI